MPYLCMMRRRFHPITITFVIALVSFTCAGQQQEQAELDRKVRAFLESRAGQWFDMNVPTNDGELLHDIIVKNGYRNALEIGTSTGHSTIWIAWALSKTGGKVITVEIDESRYREALQNFRKAGLEEYIDARLADARRLVPELEGPFDFVFSDADKSWYRNYFMAVDPKLEVNGCYTSHNVSDLSGMRWNRDYLEFLKSLENYETTVNNEGSGLAISFKRSQ